MALDRMRTRPAVVTPMPPQAGPGVPGLGHFSPVRSGSDGVSRGAPRAARRHVPSFTLAPGVFVTTLLSVNNTAHDTLDRFDPRHYDRGRLADHVRVAGKEMVSTFGHGRHACVGERFATSTMKIVVTRLLEAYELTPEFTHATPPAGQMGAVGRSAAPCPVRYRRKVGA